MIRVLLCWELGSGYGHLYPFDPVVREFERHEIRTGLASKDLSRARQVFGPGLLELFQTPVIQTPPKQFSLSINFAQNLLRNGYWYPPALADAIRKWLYLFDTFSPDYIMVDHAPTALLAARIAGIPRAAAGTGFALPPLVCPMPGLHPWLHIPDYLLRKQENRCISKINQAMHQLNEHDSTIRRITDIFEGTRIFLTIFQELDHYSRPSPEKYLGPVFSFAQGADTNWPEISGEKIFCYLNFSYHYFAETVAAIKATELPTLAVVPDIPEEKISELAGKTLSVERGNIDFKTAIRECSAVVTHGGFSTVSLALLAGKPLLILPVQLEQNLLAYRMARQGLCLAVNWLNPRPDVKSKLDQMLNSDSLYCKALDFALKYPAYNPVKTAENICREIKGSLV